MRKLIESFEISALKLVVDTFGQLSNGIKISSEEGYTSGKMLDYVYKNEPEGKLGIGKLIDKMYLEHPEWQDIRTRKSNIFLSLKEAVDYTLDKKNSARICDIASGPARYIFDILEEYKEKDVTAELRDLDIRWLLEARETAKMRGVEIDYKVANVLDKSDYNFAINPDIMVISAFYDWFDDKNVIKKTMKLIHNSLPNNGCFVFSVRTKQVNKNFSHKIFGDLNNNQFNLLTWDINIITEILDETGFKTITTRTDINEHYSVILAEKI